MLDKDGNSPHILSEFFEEMCESFDHKFSKT